MAETRKRYTGRAVDVSFDAARCRHAAECVRGLRAVFDTSRRPWILPDGAEPDDVVRVVARCPTGALRTHPVGTTAAEQPVAPTEVTALPGGPLLLGATCKSQASTRPAPRSAHAAAPPTRRTATAAGPARTGRTPLDLHPLSPATTCARARLPSRRSDRVRPARRRRPPGARSRRCAFSSMRSRCVDLLTTGTPRWTHQRRRTCARVRSRCASVRAPRG